MAELVSTDKTYVVRTARHRMNCYGRDKWWRSNRCTGHIEQGHEYVAKIEFGMVAGVMRWIRDKRHYCADCILVAVTSVTVGEAEKVA